MPFPAFAIWKTITIGTYDDVGTLRKALLDAGFRIGTWANDVLSSLHFTLAEGQKDLDLVRATPQDFGFPDGAYRVDIYERATAAGLELCPLEVGPQLRLQYADQPKLESLQISMEPQVDSTGHESEFRVVHGADDFLWLVGDHKHSHNFWEGDESFIFVKPRTDALSPDDVY